MKTKKAALPELQLGIVMKFVSYVGQTMGLPAEPAKPWFSPLITCARLLTGTEIFSAGGAQQPETEQVPE